MGFIDLFSAKVFFNFYSFGTLLVTIFTFLLALFFLTLPNKSKSTLHLGIGTFFLFLFNFGYFYASLYYSPDAAFHRWFTGGFILPAIIHLGQFFFHYPSDTRPKLSKYALIIMWAVAILVNGYFFYSTFSAPKKFHFTGHYWDFDAEPVSRFLAAFIAIYSFISFLLVMLWKAYITKGRDRRVIILMGISMLITALFPNITNIMSRDGALERSTFLLTLVFSFVLGFFLISIIYINSTTDKTSFMIKIVSITLVTMLIIMQLLSFFTMKDQDSDYDGIHLDQAEKIIQNKDYYKDTEYVVELDMYTGKVEPVQYSKSHNLDLEILKMDSQNTVLYDTILNIPEGKFLKDIKIDLENTPPHFEGYKLAILDFLKQFENKADEPVKAKTVAFIENLSSAGYISQNRISALDINNFCKEVTKYLKGKSELAFFKQAIDSNMKECSWNGMFLDNVGLRREVTKYFRYFRPSQTRTYRRSIHNYEDQRHFVSYSIYNPYLNKVTEIGFSYASYRNHVHKMAANQQAILLLVVIAIITLYPLFFRGSLINPLDSLLYGVEKVNNGDLTVKVPVKVRDEIGFLADSFNNMVTSIRTARIQLQDYAETLEEKVKLRTREVEEKMIEVQTLKNQQDGDYYLTALLAQPLLRNANKSELVKTDFLIKQKKKFNFRNKMAELGGDICVTGNLRFGQDKNNYKRYTFVMNGDAMGKSMQGAGGALVMGVMINSILARSARNDWVLNDSPDKWLTDLYYDINRTFKSFNGSMVISCVVMLINDETGDVFYFNAEHPFSVLYKNGEARFIEESMQLRKLGLDSEFPFRIFQTKLYPGDIVIIGSDGRDDIDLTPDEPMRTINEDEYLFLRHVVKGQGDLHKIQESIVALGDITDDFSLLKITYKEQFKEEETDIIDLDEIAPKRPEVAVEEALDPEKVYFKSKDLLKEGENEEAFQLLFKLHSNYPNSPKITRLLGISAYRTKRYIIAIEVMNNYLLKDPMFLEFWYYLGLSYKITGSYEKAEETAHHLLSMSPDHIQNIINLADVKRVVGKKEEAIHYTTIALNKDPGNPAAKKLMEMLRQGDTKDKLKALD